MHFNRRVENLIADFRSLPSSQSRSTLRGTVPVGSVIETILEQYRINKPRLEGVIMKHWDYIVGEHCSHRCSPQRIVRGNLLMVMVGNTTLKQEMEFEKRQILSRLRQIPDCNEIKQIRFVSGN